MSDRQLTLSLTAPNSHKLTVQRGQGSFSIGLLGMDKNKCDVLVDNSLPLNWNAFDTEFTGAGSHWPRFFYYYGDDTGFIPWSQTRPIESLFWSPSQAADIDLSHANIATFELHNTHGATISPSPNTYRLILLGDLSGITIRSGQLRPQLSVIFKPSLKPNITSNSQDTPYQLPSFKALAEITSLDISGSISGQAIDCASLLQFPHLTSLSLSGHLANLPSLALLTHLEHLALRFVPNLDDLPTLATWPAITSLISWNIEETAGKRLKKELKAIAQEKQLTEYSNVSQLRSKTWFALEANLPFAGWSHAKNAKAATKAFKTTTKKILKAKTKDDVKTLIETFTQAINPLPGIETTEREDVWRAITTLIQASPVETELDQANQWFDAVRDF